MATGGTSFRPGSQGNLGSALNQFGSGLYGLIKPFVQPTPYGKNPWGSSSTPRSPKANRPVGTQAVLNNKPVYWGGDNYGWQQLNQTGSSATLNALNTPSAQGRFIQDQSSSPAADRAYQQEVSRVAQLTAQDPELQRYEQARQKAVAAGPGSAAEQSAEDLGMQIWAQKYGKTLAPKVKRGQAGYDVIQNTLAGNAARAGAGFKLPDQLVPTPAGFPTAVPAFTQTAPGGYDRGFGITTNLAPKATLQALQPTPTAMPAASPTFNLGAAFGQPGVLDEETLKRFSDILLQSAK